MQKNKIIVTPAKIIPHYLIAILIFGVGLLAYHRTLFLKGVFIFDDLKLIVDNPLIKNFSYIKDIFKTQLFHGSGEYSNFYRPIQSLSFMMDYHFWRLNPFGYCLVNVLTHIFTSVLVYFFIYIVSKKQDIAIITSLLFCVHTVLSWPVNYISSRADLFSAFFILATAILYVLYTERPNDKFDFLLFLFSSVCFVLALLSKEVSIIFLFVLFLYPYCFNEKGKNLNKSAQNVIWSFLIIAVIYILLRATILNFTKEKLLETTTGLIPLHLRLFTFSKVFMIYLRLLVFPTGLHMEWDIKPATSFLEEEIFLSITGLIIIVWFTYFLFRTSKLKFFAIAWFFIMLIPYSNIFPLAYFMGEGWLYMPSIGFFALSAMYLSELRKKSKIWSKIVIVIVYSALVFYSILTIKRSDVWKDPVKLYTEILKYSPNSTKARINLGVTLEKSGLHIKAMGKYKEAVDLDPENINAHINMASIYFNKQKYDEALEELNKAFALNPNNYIIYNDIGLCYKNKGETQKAIDAYEKSIELNPNYPVVYSNIGNIYLGLGNYDSAVAAYKKAVALDPDNSIFYANLGNVYKNKKMLKEARESFKKALQLNPNNKDATDNLNTLK